MGGISLKDRRTNEELRRMVGVEPITTVIRRGRRDGMDKQIYANYNGEAYAMTCNQYYDIQNLI